MHIQPTNRVKVCAEKKPRCIAALQISDRMLSRLLAFTAQCTLLIVLWLVAPEAQAIITDDLGSGELRLRSLPFNSASVEAANDPEGQSGVWHSAPQLGTRVDMEINGLIAKVTVVQRFRNNSNDFVEGHYVFPLPYAAAVNAMTMQIGERLIVGEIHEKEAAKQIYANAKAAGQRTAITQQHHGNLFSNRVANIAPGEEVSVTLTYLEHVRFSQDRFSLRLPLTITPRYIPGQRLTGFTEHGFSSALANDRVADAADITPFQHAPPHGPSDTANTVQLHATLNPGLTLAHISSAYHDISIEQQDGGYRIALSETVVPMDRDFELSWQAAASAAPQAAVFSETVAGEQFILLMVVPPELTSDATRIPREVIFVIDVSGSMHGQSIDQARAALAQGLSSLHGDDHFNVIAFHHETRQLFDRAQLASGSYLQDALRFVHGLQADGGTEMAPAIAAALARPSINRREDLRQVVFITDGAVGSEQELFRQISAQLADSRLFTVGIGAAPNSYFMRKAAQFGRGTYTHIGDTAEVQYKMAGLFSQLESPQLKDIQVAWPGRTEVFPLRVPDLYQGEPLVLTARLNGSTGYRDNGVAISGGTPAGNWQQRLRLERNASSPGVAALWAKEKIAALEDIRAEQGASDALRSAIIDIALLHQLVSRYTAFVAVEKTPVRPMTDPLHVRAVPNALPAGQAMVSLPYPQTATNAFGRIQVALLCLVFALQLWWLRRRDRQRVKRSVKAVRHA